MTLFAPYSALPYQTLKQRLSVMVLALVSWLAPATGAEQDWDKCPIHAEPLQYDYEQ